MQLLLLAARTLYLFAPLIVASALSAVVLRWDFLPCLRRPIDGGVRWRGRRLLGDSKTWRGVAVALAGCVAATVAQRYAVGDRARWLAIVNYRDIPVVLFGAAMGCGAMVGELPNSFVKRRLAIAPGETARGPLAVLFYVWDQVDLLTGCWPLLWQWAHPPWPVVAMSFALALGVHPLVSLAGYLVGARRSAR